MKFELDYKKVCILTGLSNTLVFEIMLIRLKEPLWFMMLMVIVSFSIPFVVTKYIRKYFIHKDDMFNYQAIGLLSAGVSYIIFIPTYYINQNIHLPIAIIIIMLITLCIIVPIIFIRNNYDFLKSMVQILIVGTIASIIAVFIQLVIMSIDIYNG